MHFLGKSKIFIFWETHTKKFLKTKNKIFAFFWGRAKFLKISKANFCFREPSRQTQTRKTHHKQKAHTKSQAIKKHQAHQAKKSWHDQAKPIKWT